MPSMFMSCPKLYPVMVLALVTTAVSSFQHFPVLQGRSDNILPSRRAGSAVLPTGRPGLAAPGLLARGRQALLALMGGRKAEERRRIKRKIINMEFKPWQRGQQVPGSLGWL